MKLIYFIQPEILERIGVPRLFKFLDEYADDLQAANIRLPVPVSENDDHFASVAAIMANPARLPERLRAALLTLEAAASPENQDRLNAAIERRLPNVSLSSCPLDRALELWFLVPEELSQFQPPELSTLNSEAPPVGPLPPAGPSLSRNATIHQSSNPVIQPSSIPPIHPFPDSAADDETFKHLARLSPAQYDRARRIGARRLHLRIETLDNQVAKYRAELDLQAQANAVHLPAIEPWPEPVDGPEVLDQVCSRYCLYLFLPSGAPNAITLWTAHSHAFAAFHLSPRLSLYSPKPGCGKTTAFDVLTTMVPRPLRTENISPAVLFRLVDQHQPTLLLDEVDAYLPQSEELRGLLNAGHKRGACAYRCEGEGKAVRAFHAFAPAALAGIGSLPATLRDRSVLIPLVAAQEGQVTTRFDPLRTEIETTLARKLARWVGDNFDALAACDPPLPPGAFNRLADNWRPLFVVAHIAGGDWPARALDAFHKLATPHSNGGFPSPPRPGREIKGEVSLSPLDAESITLLADIRQIFTKSTKTRMSSHELVTSLCALPDRPYSQSSVLNHQTSKLARRLSSLGIRSRTVRISGQCTRGYQLTDFAKAFAQFLDTGPAAGTHMGYSLSTHMGYTFGPGARKCTSYRDTSSQAPKGRKGGVCEEVGSRPPSLPTSVPTPPRVEKV